MILKCTFAPFNTVLLNLEFIFSHIQKQKRAKKHYRRQFSHIAQHSKNKVALLLQMYIIMCRVKYTYIVCSKRLLLSITHPLKSNSQDLLPLLVENMVASKNIILLNCVDLIMLVITST